MILRSQAGQIQAGLGSLLQGFQQGFEKAKERARQREEMEHRKKQLDLQLKLHDLQIQGEQRKIKEALRQQMLGEEAAQLSMPGAAQPTTETEMGDQPVGAVPLGEDQRQQRLRAKLIQIDPKGFAASQFKPQPKSLEDLLAEQARFQQLAGAGGGGAPSVATTHELTSTPTGPRLTPKREPMGEMSSIFKSFEKEKRALGWSDEQIRNEWPKVRQTWSAATATGQVIGRGTPEALASQTAQEAAKAAGRPVEAGIQTQMSALETLLTNTIPNIRQNAKAEFLGPIKGTGVGFEARRRFGTAMGAPLAPGETTFRQALKDAGDQLLRARSGAQINEQEYGRLAGLLPKATDEPAVFAEGLQRFEQEMRTILAAKRRVAVTPRGQLGERPTLPPPPAGWR